MPAARTARTTRTADLADLRKTLRGAAISKPGNDGMFGTSVVVRTTDTADRIVDLANRCGATIIERVVFSRAWGQKVRGADGAVRLIKSQAIRLVVGGATVDEDLYLAGVIDAKTMRSRARG